MGNQDVQSRGYSPTQAQRLLLEFEKLERSAPAVQVDLLHLATQLTQPRAYTFATEGAGRRLGVIARCASNIFNIYPPDRSEFLSSEECTDVGIQLQAFAINVYAMFDNVAWICVLEKKASLHPRNVGPFNKECRPYLAKDLIDYLDSETTRNWFDNYGKAYRDSTAHRIPLYLPSRTYSHEDAALWKQLRADASAAMEAAFSMEARQARHELLDRHHELTARADALGQNSLLMGLTLSAGDASAPVFLHGQILCDWGLAQELVTTFTKALRRENGWSPPPRLPLP